MYGAFYVICIYNFAKIMYSAILENFILRQILENFSDHEIKVREPWDTNSKLDDRATFSLLQRMSTLLA